MYSKVHNEWKVRYFSYAFKINLKTFCSVKIVRKFTKTHIKKKKKNHESRFLKFCQYYLLLLSLLKYVMSNVKLGLFDSFCLSVCCLFFSWFIFKLNIIKCLCGMYIKKIKVNYKISLNMPITIANCLAAKSLLMICNLNFFEFVFSILDNFFYFIFLRFI